MVTYCENVKRCRHLVLLDYFETAPPPTSSSSSLSDTLNNNNTSSSSQDTAQVCPNKRCDICLNPSKVAEDKLKSTTSHAGRFLGTTASLDQVIDLSKSTLPMPSSDFTTFRLKDGSFVSTAGSTSSRSGGGGVYNSLFDVGEEGLGGGSGYGRVGGSSKRRNYYVDDNNDKDDDEGGSTFKSAADKRLFLFGKRAPSTTKPISSSSSSRSFSTSNISSGRFVKVGSKPILTTTFQPLESNHCVLELTTEIRHETFDKMVSVVGELLPISDDSAWTGVEKACSSAENRRLVSPDYWIFLTVYTHQSLLHTL